MVFKAHYLFACFYYGRSNTSPTMKHIFTSFIKLDGHARAIFEKFMMTLVSCFVCAKNFV